MIDSVSVAIVDQQPIFRAGLSQIISGGNRCRVIAEGQSDDDAINIANELTPEILLLGTNVTGCGRALQSISKSVTSIKTIMMANIGSERTLTASLQAGARGYVLKDVRGEQLLEILKTVHSGRMYMDPTLAADVLSGRFSNDIDNVSRMFSQLTVREKEVLHAASRGLTNKEIARLHGSISEKTIKHQMTNILQKLRSRNRVEAIIKARECLTGWQTDLTIE